MTNEELFATVRASGLIPVQVRNEGDFEAASRAHFDGGLDQFLAAAKEIGTKVIFIEPTALEDWLFNYNPADNNEDDPDAVDEDIDLASISTSLAKYKRYIGQHYTLFLSAKGGAADLNYVLDQEWVEQFESELETAQEKADIQIITSKIRQDKGSRN
jgi:hypothetical protein